MIHQIIYFIIFYLYQPEYIQHLLFSADTLFLVRNKYDVTNSKILVYVEERKESFKEKTIQV